jgi:hypothetical protein
MRTGHAALAAIALVFAAPAARADSPEDAYIAARDKAIAEMTEKSAGGTTSTELDAEGERLRAALEPLLRGVVDPAAPAGFSGPPEMRPNTVFPPESDEDAGLLDGFSFSASGPSGRVLVTTEGLLRRWLQGHKSWWEKGHNPPTDPAAAFRSDAFYTQAVSRGAAFSIFATVPIRKPQGADAAVALLVEESQDQGVFPPDELAVSVIERGRVFIAIVATKKFAPIAACAAVLKGFEAKAEATHNPDVAARYGKDVDAFALLENEGETAFQKCWAKRVISDPAFAAVTRQAQALADAFAAP